MDYSRKCMSIQSIVDHSNTTTPVEEMPLSPPDSYRSRSPTVSPRIDSMSYTPTERRHSCQIPMSIEERRYRNKLASAKYRAKKQASTKSMTNKVSQLMTTNTALQKELNRVKQENEVLRAMLLSQQAATTASSSSLSSSSSVPSLPHHPHQRIASYY
ncbi:MAG: hypothetical protein EXX96DRAFT_565499 [Benjaminiella poitrasii]|nr:MAG: hypothetical protein EXX96DRAFT_565499 [Benjaminiella poitrasii]